MDAVQFYETTIYNRDDNRGFSFVTVPRRSIATGEIPDAREVARLLDLHGPRDAGEYPIGVAPVDAWSLPFLLDAAMRRYIGFPYEFGFFFDPAEPRRGTTGRGPTPFAQHLAFAPVVPVESSPLRNRSLSEIVTTSAGASIALGSYAATDEPLVLLATPLLIIVCGAAEGIGQALQIGLRSLLLNLMGVQDPTAPQPQPDEPEPGEPGEPEPGEN